MKILAFLGTAIGLLQATPVFANWTEHTTTDRLTGEKRVSVESKSRVPVNVRRRTVVPVLLANCLRPQDSHPYLGVFIAFPTFVGFSDVEMRYRYDEKPVTQRTIGASRDGTYFQIPTSDNAVLDEIKSSSRLRVELSFPDQDAFMDFDTRNAAVAFGKIRCE